MQHQSDPDHSLNKCSSTQALGNINNQMIQIPEPDWKTFKAVRAVALERFAQRILDEYQELCCNETVTAHQRYGELYSVIGKRNSEMAQIFDDYRRSTALISLRLMWQHGLLKSEEISQFSHETQSIVEFDG